jgi:hypothetical protein
MVGINFFEKYGSYKFVRVYCMLCNMYELLGDYRTTTSIIFALYVQCKGYAVAQLVEALCYKPEGRGIDSL